MDLSPSPSSLQLDSKSFFFDITPGAESGVSGFVTLLAAAHALRNAQLAELKHNIFYTFFQGVSCFRTIVCLTVLNTLARFDVVLPVLLMLSVHLF